MSGHLFDLPALEPAARSTTGNQALGASSEYLLIGRLLELGHRVAVPVTDDDGVDLVVNYATKVQVKSSGYRSASGQLHVSLNGRRSGERGGDKGCIRPHVDIVAVYARDSRSWWFLPRDEVTTQTLYLAEHGRRACWHEAWHVFDTHRGGGA